MKLKIAEAKLVKIGIERDITALKEQLEFAIASSDGQNKNLDRWHIDLSTKYQSLEDIDDLILHARERLEVPGTGNLTRASLKLEVWVSRHRDLVEGLNKTKARLMSASLEQIDTMRGIIDALEREADIYLKGARELELAIERIEWTVDIESNWISESKSV